MQACLAVARDAPAVYTALYADSALAAAAHADNPTKVKIAGVLSAGKEAPWETSFINSMNRVIAARPHGLDVEVEWTRLQARGDGRDVLA